MSDRDELEQEYFRLLKLFTSGPFKHFSTPKELKELGDLLKYRRLKKELEGIDEEKLIEALLKQIKEITEALGAL